MADYGVRLYGNAIMVNTKFADEKPEAVKAFLRAYVKALRETVRDPARAVDVGGETQRTAPRKTSSSNACAWRSATTFSPRR